MNVIVIPTYKEKETLKHNLPLIKKYIGKEDLILLIDDTKNFETRQFESRQVKCFPRLDKKRGYGKSLKFGLMIASYLPESDFIIQMDADHIPKDLTKFLDHNSEIIIGYEDKPRITSKIGSWLSRRLGLKQKQSTCGFRMFKNKVLKYFEWNKIKAKGFSIQIEILYNLQSYKIKEVPITRDKRKWNKSKLGLRQMIDFLRTYRRLLTKHLYYSLIIIIKGKRQ